MGERRAIGAATIAEAFRLTVEDHPDRIAVRTLHDEVAYTWAAAARQGRRARRRAAPARRPPRRHRRADDLQPPGVHDRRPGGDDARRDAVLDLPDVRARPGPLRRSRTPRRRSRSSRSRSAPLVTGLVEHVLTVGDWPEDPDFDAGAALARRRGRRHPHADLHQRDDRPAEGRPDRAPQPDGGGRRRRAAGRLPGRLARDQLAAERARRRAHRAPLPPDRLRDDDHHVPRPAPDRHLPAGGQADLVLRRPARVGEAQGGRRGQARRRRAGDEAARGRYAAGRARAGGAAGPAGAAAGPRRRRGRSSSRRCGPRSGSTRRSWSTSAPRRRRARCSCSSTPSASRWPRSGG